MKKTINWAVAGTGGITNAFVRGLKVAEGANILAVASRSKDNAERFAAKYGAQRAYAGFDAMLDDRDVDIVYLGVPHSAHKELALKAFQAGKAVLCEKPAAINAAELAQMIEYARKYHVFFMEAMWSRFVPPVHKAREWIADGLIGEARMVQGNFGFKADVPPGNRLRNISLGGGALLDAGVYPISFASMVFGGKRPRKISGTMTLGETGVDEESAALIEWGARQTAFVSSAISLSTVNDLWIYGTEGSVHLPSFVFCRSANLALPGRPPYHWEGDFRGNGYNYEAEAVMDCLREGREECDVMPLDESLVIAEIMDEIRRQGGLKYPGETPE
ncbi:MAG: Gfo/Idh/MocA family oxidoreductase [Spirochaetaceae bacterium]|jgi:predicted dehydrogenase|nr:Gfo/Idh/MocA family oxidoreductase [Spirochaetaceae bacterium]